MIGGLLFLAGGWWERSAHSRRPLPKTAPKASAKSQAASNRSAVPKGDPSDYFPTDIGRTWRYNITIVDDGENALFARWTLWELLGGQQVLTMERGRHLPHPDNRHADGVYKLTLRIAERAARQGHLQYPEGYRVEIVRDDLKIFEQPQSLFYAISRTPRYTLEQVRVVHPHSSSAPSRSRGAWNTNPGYDHSLLFFGQPNISMDLGSRGDVLMWAGQKTDDKGRPAILFRRTVTPKKMGSNPSSFERQFVEERLFVYQVGMVSLIQKVGGRVTMAWLLQE